MKTRLAQLALCIAGILSVVSCGNQQPEYAGEVGALASTNVETTIPSPEQPVQDPLPEWKRERPLLVKSLHLMGKPASELKDILGEPASNSEANSTARKYGKGKVHNSRTYTWVESRQLHAQVAIGNNSKKVEAVLIEVVGLADAPLLTDIFQEMNATESGWQLYAKERFGSNPWIFWVRTSDSVMTRILSYFSGEAIMTRSETDLETGNVRKFVFRSPNLVPAKARLSILYIGPEDVDPFDPEGGPPRVWGAKVPDTETEIGK